MARTSYIFDEMMMFTLY